MAPECLRRTQLSEVGWQSIPHSWSGDTECSVSELPICPWQRDKTVVSITEAYTCTRRDRRRLLAVFGVTLRLLVIHFVVVSRRQQLRRLPTTSVINSP